MHAGAAQRAHEASMPGPHLPRKPASRNNRSSMLKSQQARRPAPVCPQMIPQHDSAGQTSQVKNTRVIAPFAPAEFPLRPSAACGPLTMQRRSDTWRRASCRRAVQLTQAKLQHQGRCRAAPLFAQPNCRNKLGATSGPLQAGSALRALYAAVRPLDAAQLGGRERRRAVQQRLALLLILHRQATEAFP
jgi:hypothetical protein